MSQTIKINADFLKSSFYYGNLTEIFKKIAKQIDNIMYERMVIGPGRIERCLFNHRHEQYPQVSAT